jgi:hypothetical protein
MDGDLGRLVLGAVSVPYMRPHSYYATRAWRGTWELDGGALMNEGIHFCRVIYDPGSSYGVIPPATAYSCRFGLDTRASSASTQPRNVCRLSTPSLA